MSDFLGMLLSCCIIRKRPVGFSLVSKSMIIFGEPIESGVVVMKEAGARVFWGILLDEWMRRHALLSIRPTAFHAHMVCVVSTVNTNFSPLVPIWLDRSVVVA